MKDSKNKLVEWYVYQEVGITFPTHMEYIDFVTRYEAMTAATKDINDKINQSDEPISR